MGNQQPFHSDIQTDDSHTDGFAGYCHYLRPGGQFPKAMAGTEAAINAAEQRICHAAPTAFTPSAVHQSSCCLNPANFTRCPYYVEAMGQQKKQIDLRTRKRSVSARLAHQLARLFPFTRSMRKKRRRIYFFLL